MCSNLNSAHTSLTNSASAGVLFLFPMNLIRVKAFPDSKKAHIEETSPNVFRVFVREPAERNLANQAVIKAVATYLNIPAKQLIIKTGHRSLNKTLLILGK